MAITDKASSGLTAVHSAEQTGALGLAFSLQGGSGLGVANGGAEPLRQAGNFPFLERGAMGITPLYNSFGHISEDTVHLSIWCDWGIEKNTLFQRLQRCQDEVRAKTQEVAAEDEAENPDLYGVDESMIEYQEEPNSCVPGGGRYIEGFGRGWFEFGRQLWRVKVHGIGGKDGRSYYPYAITAGGVLIAFRRDKHDTVSNMWVEIGSIPLAQNGGLEGVWKQLQEIFKLEGITVLKDLVSRVDIYGDFPEVPIREFYERFTGNCRITRARKIGQYEEEMNVASYMVGMRQTGFSIGTNLKLRVYDKNYELRRDPVKWAVFAQKYGRIPDVLTRVEFQLRRVALKEFYYETPLLKGFSHQGQRPIEGVSTYLEAREQLWKYLTDDWFRLTEDKVDSRNNNQQRAKTWSVWQVVQQAVKDVKESIVRFHCTAKIDMDGLFRQGLGCVSKVATYEGQGEINSPRELALYFYNRMKQLDLREFRRIMEKHYEDFNEVIGYFPGMSASV